MIDHQYGRCLGCNKDVWKWQKCIMICKVFGFLKSWYLYNRVSSPMLSCRHVSIDMAIIRLTGLPRMTLMHPDRHLHSSCPMNRLLLYCPSSISKTSESNSMFFTKSLDKLWVINTFLGTKTSEILWDLIYDTQGIPSVLRSGSPPRCHGAKNNPAAKQSRLNRIRAAARHGRKKTL